MLYIHTTLSLDNSAQVESLVSQIFSDLTVGIYVNKCRMERNLCLQYKWYGNWRKLNLEILTKIYQILKSLPNTILVNDKCKFTGI